MKLIIQIPCLNEEETLPETIADLPKDIAGIDVVEILIIDDGSTDRTAEVARGLGVDHIVRHNVNLGLAAAFQNGLNASIQAGADIIVNTDADNQYPGSSIPELIRPVLEGNADMVIGDRQPSEIGHFSMPKKLLQRFGSAVVRHVSGTTVPDAPSGFRAISREAALRLNVQTSFSYTLETIIQAGRRNLVVGHVPIVTNEVLRESRLMRSNFHYVRRSMATILRLFVLYEPLKTFIFLGLPFFLLGMTLWARFLALLIVGEAARGSHVQSIVVGGVAIMMALLLWGMGLIGDLLATNRRINEEALYHLRRTAYRGDPHDSLTAHDTEDGPASQ
ncbi:glycosyltransferase family 2 protein [Dehalococcoidia bacterium]|nr:glycosyltransferase family 2 protein [Dehalococcoidia bacterium]